MVATVTGSGLGLFNTQAAGADEQRGAVNATGGAVVVNASTGNLVLSDVDEWLAGRGLDAQVVRTYNSRGLYDDDNGDNFRFSFSQQLKNFIAGASIVRVNGDGSENTFTYDSASGLYISTDGAGAHDTLRFDGSAAWTYREGSSGLTETYAWNGVGGRLTSQLDAEGLGIIAIAYDGDGRVIGLDDSSGQTLTVLRDADGNVTSLQTSSDGETRNIVSYTYETYTAGGATRTRLHSVRFDLTPDNTADDAVYVTTYTYLNSTSNLIASIAHSDGTTMSFEYDGADNNSRVTRVTVGGGADAQVTEYVYSAGGTDVKQQLAAGVYAVTTVNYDSAGRITSVLTPPDANGQRLTTSYVYDAAGNVIKTTDARNASTYFSYDAAGNRILQQDELGNTTQWIYDDRNRLQNEITYTGRDSTPGDGVNDATGALTIRYVYDSVGRLRFVVGNDGSVKETRYSDSGSGGGATRTITEIVYGANRYAVAGLAGADTTLLENDLTGWLAGLTDKSGAQVVATRLDFRGQVAQVTRYANTLGDGSGDPAQASTTYSLYDPSGRLLRSVDARGSGIADTAYDTVYTYDGLGRRLSVSTSTSASTDQSITTLYDDAGRRIVTGQANGLRIVSTYNSVGQVTSVQELDGLDAVLSATRYVYDNNGRLRAGIDPVGGTTYYFYDQLGRQVGSIDGTGALTEHVYNGAGQLVKQIRYARFVDAAALTALAGAALGGHFAAATAVDPLDGLRPAPDPSNDRIEQNIYDRAGQLWCAIDAGGAVTEYRYDGAGRLLRRIEHAVAPAVLSGLYGADPVLASAGGGETLLSGYTLPDTAAVARINAKVYDALTGALVTEVDTDPAAFELVHGSGSYDGRIFLSGGGTALADGRYRVVLTVFDGDNELLGTDLLLVGLGAPERFTLAGGRGVDAIYGAQALPGTTLDRVTEYWYDAAGRLRGTLETDGRYTAYRYNAAGQVVETLRYAAVTTSAEARADTVAAHADDIHTYAVYDQAGRLLADIDGEGYVTVRTYAANGALLVSRRYGRSITRADSPDGGLLAAALAAVGLDAARLTQSAIEPETDTQRDAVTTYTYDQLNRLASVTDARGITTVYAYNSEGQLLSAGLIAAGATPPAQPFGEALYDLQGRLLENRGARYFDEADSAYLLARYTYASDAAGRRISSTDARGNTTLFIYDSAGRLHYEVNAAREVLIYAYNGFGEQAALTRCPLPLPAGLALTDSAIAAYLGLVAPADGLFFYNPRGQQEYAVDAQGHVTAFNYDAGGNRVAIIRYQTALPDYAALTAADRDTVAAFVAAQPLAATQTEYRVYNDIDQLRFVIDPRGAVTEYRYDGLGEVVQEIGHTAAVPGWVARDEQSLADFYSGVATADLQQQFLLWRDRLARTLANLSPGAAPLDRGEWELEPDSSPFYGETDWTEIKARIRAGLLAQGRALGAALNALDPAELDVLRQLLQFGDGLTVNVAADEPALGELLSPMGALQLADTNPGALEALTLAQSSGETLAAYIEHCFVAAGERLIASLAAQAGDLETLTLATTLPDPLVGPENFVEPRPFLELIGQLGDQTPDVQQSITTMLFLVLVGVDVASMTAYYDTTAGQMVFVAPVMEGVPEVTGYSAVLAPIGAGPALAALDRYLGSAAQADAQQTNRHRFHDALGRMTFEVDALGYVTTYAYDGNGNVTATSRYRQSLWSADTGAGQRRALTEAAVRDFIAAREPLADSHSSTAFVYNGAGQRLYEVDALGYVTGYTYDARGDRVGETRYAQALADIDAFLAEPEAPSGPASRSYRYYDSAGQLRDEVDALGRLTRYDYDANGNIVRTTRFQDSLWNWSDPVLGASNGDSRPDTALVADFIAETDSGRSVWQYVYDSADRLGADIDPEGTVTTYTYDGRGNVTSRRVYNTPLGGALADFLAAQSAPAASVIEYTLYDAADRAIYRVDAGGYITAYSYDANGQITGSITYTAPLREDIATFRADPAALLADPRYAAAVADYLYYERGQPRLGIDQGSILTEYHYDTRGNLIELTRSQWRAGASGAPLALPPGIRPSEQQLEDFAVQHGAVNVILERTRYTYDAENQLRYTVDPTGLITEYRYDVNGEVVATFRYDRALPDWLSIDTVSLDDYLAQRASPRLAAQLAAHWLALLGLWPDRAAPAWDGSLLAMGQVPDRADTASWAELGAQVETEALAQAQAMVALLRSTYGADYAFIEQMLRATDGRALNLTISSEEVTERYIAHASYYTDNLGNVLYERFDAYGNLYYVTIDAENVETPFEGGSLIQYVDTRVSDDDPADLEVSQVLAWLPGENLEQYLARRYLAAAQQLIGALQNRGETAETFSFTLGGLNVQNFSDLKSDPNVLAALAAIGFTGSLDGLTLTAFSNPLAGLIGGGATAVSVSGVRDVAEGVPELAGIELRPGWVADLDSLPVIAAPGTHETYVSTFTGLAMTNLDDPRQDPVVIAVLSAMAGAGYIGVFSDAVLNVSQNPDGVSWDLTVSRNARLSAQLLAQFRPESGDGGATGEYAYFDARGQKRYSLDANGFVTAFSYDRQGHLIGSRAYRVPFAGAGLSRPAPDALEQFIAGQEAAATSAQPAAVTTHFYYDALGQLSYRVDGLGYVVGYDYDSLGRVIATTGFSAPLSGALADFVATGSADASRIYTYYDAAGRAIYQIDGLGYVTRNEYDSRGNLLRASVYERSLWSSPGSDPLLRPAAATVADFIAAQAANRLLRTFVYDADNRCIRSTDPDGVVTVFSYDGLGNLLSRTVLGDQAGALTRLDPDFGAGAPVLTALVGSFEAHATLQQSDGKLVVLGSLQGGAGSDLVLVRYLADGGLDTTFGDGGVVVTDLAANDTAAALIQQDDGKLVVAGSAENSGGDGVSVLVRYQADGGLDLGFGVGGVVTLQQTGRDLYGFSVIQQGGGELVLLATTTQDGDPPTSRVLLARFAGDGSPDAGFGDGGIATVQLSGEGAAHTLLQRPDGRLLVVGYGVNASLESYESFQLQYLANGLPDESFGSGGLVTTSLLGASGETVGLTMSAALQADGRLVMGGYAYTIANGDVSFMVQRYNADGTLDTGFGEGGSVFAMAGSLSYGFALSVQRDGKLLVGGMAQVGEGSALAVLRFTAEGVVDQSFGDHGAYLSAIGDNGMVGALLQQADGKLVAAGFADQALALLRFDTEGSTEHFIYDAAGRLRYAVDAEGYVTAYEYDALGDLIAGTRYRDALTIDIEALRAAPGPVLSNAAVEAREYHYYRNGQRYLTVDAEGYVTRYAYDYRGRMIEATAADRSLWTQAALDRTERPDAAAVEAFLAAREAAAGNTVDTRHYVYDARGALRFVVGDDGRLEETRYDAAGRVVQRITHVFKAPSGIVYSESALAALVVSEGAGIGEFVYLDDRGQVLYSLDSNGFVSANRYDDSGNVLGITRYQRSFWSDSAPGPDRPAQSAIEAFIAARELAIAGGTERASVFRFAYDALDQLRYQIDGEGYVTRYDYDALGRMVRLHRFATALPPAAATDTASLDTVFDSAPAIATTAFYYQGTRLWSTVDASGGVVVFGYDTQGSVVRTERFTAHTDATDASALRIFIEQQRTAGAVVVERSVYDANGRELFRVDGAGFVTRYSHDAAGRLVLSEQFATAWAPAADQAEACDEAALAAFAAAQGASASRWFYDAAGRARLYLDRNGYATLNSYDAAGNIRAAYRSLAPLSSTLLASAGSGYAAIAYAMLEGSVESEAAYYVHDEHGQVVLQSDGTGLLTSTRYDPRGRVAYSARYLPAQPLPGIAALIAAAGLSVGIDPGAAQLLAIEDLIDDAFRASLDGATRVAQTLHRYDAIEQRQYDIDTLGRVTESVYNADGGLACTLLYAHLTIPDTAAWDGAFDIDSYISAADRADPANRKTVYYYDHNGALRYSVDAQGFVVERRYDAGGRLAMQIVYQQPLAGPDADVSGLDVGAAYITRYAYDGLGQLRFSSAAAGQITESRYDGLGNLVESIEWNVAPAALAAFDVNTIDTLLAAGAEGALTRFEYDGRGYLIAERNGLRVVRNGAGDTIEGVAGVIHYLRDVFGRMRYQVDALGFVTAYDYDDQDNVIGGAQYAEPLGAELAAFLAGPETVLSGRAVLGRFLHYYDGAGNLTAQIDASGYVTRYRFDARGNLIETIDYNSALWSAPEGAALDRGQRPGEAALDAFFAGQALAAQVTHFAFDARNRLQFTVDNDRRITGFVHDTSGAVIQQIAYTELLPDWVGFEADDIRAFVDAAPTPALAQRLTDFLGGLLASWQDAFGDALISFAELGAANLAQGNWPAVRAQVAMVAANKVHAFIAALQQNCGDEYALLERFLQLNGGAGIGLSLIGRERSTEQTAVTIFNPDILKLRDTDVTLTIHDATTEAQGGGSLVNDGSESFEASLLRLFLQVGAQVMDGFEASQDEANTYTLTLDNLYGPVPESSSGVVNVAALENQQTIADVLAMWPQLAGHITDATVTGYSDFWDYLQLQGTLPEGAPDLASLAFALSAPSLGPAQVQTFLDALTPSGHSDQWFYRDASGRLLHTLDSSGAVRSTLYDARGHVLGTRLTPAAFWTSSQAAGLAPGERPPAAAVAAFADAGAALFDGHAVTLYNALGLVGYTVDARGYVTRYSYDALGNTVRIELGAQALATGAALDADNLAVFLADQATAGQLQVSDQVYAGNRLRFSVDSAGRVTEYGYDARGNVVVESRFAAPAPARDLAALEVFAAGQRASHPADVRSSHAAFNARSERIFAVDAGGFATQSVYDAYGNVIAQRRYGTAYVASGADPFGAAALAAFFAEPAQADRSETLYFYAANGQVALVVDPGGYAIAYGYDRDGALSASQRSLAPIEPALLAQGCDAVIRAMLTGAVASRGDYTITRDGQPLYQIDATGYLTVYRYDDQGRLLEIRRYREPIAPRTLAQVLGAEPEAQADAVALRRWQQLLRADRLASIALLISGAERDNYDIEQRGNYSDANPRYYSVDALGRVTGSTYDGAGRLIERTVYEGALVTRAELHDPAFDLAAFIEGGSFAGQTSRYYYDGGDQPSFSVDELGQVREQRYDERGHLVQLLEYTARLADADSLPGGAEFALVLAGDARVSHFSYSADGRLLLRVDGAGFATVYAYAGNGQVLASLRSVEPVALADPFDALALGRALLNGEIASTVTLNDEFGRALYALDAEGFVTVYRYDGQGLPALSLRLKQAATPLTLAQVLGEPPAAAPGEALLLHWLQLQQAAQREALGALVSAAAPQDYTLLERTLYSADGRRRFSVDGDGAVTEQRYTAAGQLVQRIVYANARVSPAQLADSGFDLAQFIDGASCPNRMEVYHYDSEGGIALIESRERIGATVQSVACYDGEGRLRFSVDSLQFVLEIRYRADGTVAERIDYRERLGTLDNPDFTGLTPKVIYRHDDEGRLRYTVDALGAVEELRYDSAGNVIARLRYAQTLASIDSTDYSVLIEADARGERYVYDEDNRLRYAIDGEGYVRETRYDAAGQVAESIQWLNAPSVIPAGAPDAATLALALTGSAFQRTAYTYDNAGRVLSITDAAGAVERFSYDADGHLASQTTRDGQVWTYTYDAAGRMETKSSPAVAVTVPGRSPETEVQRLVTRYTYDAAGNMLSETQADGTAFARTITFTYDAGNRLLTTTRTGSEAVTGFTWDSALNLFTPSLASAPVTRQQWYDSRGNVVVSKDEDGHYHYRVYDEQDQLRFEVDGAGWVTSYTYDGYGNIQTLTMHANAVDLGDRDPAAALAFGELEALLQPARDSGRDRTIVYVYDALGREIERIQPESFSVVVDGLGGSGAGVTGQAMAATTLTTYNSFGEVASSAETVWVNGVLASTARVVSYEYNRRGERIAQVDADLYRTAWEYDAAGNITKTTEYANAATERATPPAGSVEDRVVVTTYDLRNQLQSEQRLNVDYYNGSAMARATVTTHYDYDDAGRISRITTAPGVFSTFTYDALGRIASMTEPTRALNTATPPATATPVTSYAYDAFGNAVRETREAGHAGAPANSVIERRYDALDHVIREQDALGLVTEFSYDNAGHLLRSWYAQDAETLVQTVYAYDSRGNQIGVARERVQAGTTDAAADQWQRFNAFGEIEAKGMGATAFEYFEYDQAGRLLRSNAGDGVVRLYGYDAYGRTALVAMDATAANFAGIAALEALFNAGTWQQHSHMLLTCETGGVVTESAPTTGAIAGPITVKVQDRWGNVVREFGPGGEDTSYVYDDANRLVSTTVHGIDYLQDGTLAAIVDGDITSLVYYDLAGNEIGRRDGNGHARFKSYNVAGQVLSESNALNQVTRYSYDGFGRVLTETSPLGNVRTNGYDAGGRLIDTVLGPDHLSFSYDRDGRRTQVVEHYSTGNRTTTYRYDLNGNLVETRNPDGLLTLYGYDGYGNQTSEEVRRDDTAKTLISTQSWGFAEGYFHRLGWHIDKTGAWTSYEYGAGLRLTRENQSSGASKTYVYNGRGLLQSIIEADAGVTSATTYSYDDSGNRTGERYARGVSIVDGAATGGTVYQSSTLSYDRAHRLTGVRDTGTARPELDLTYQYDAAGNRIAVKDMLTGHSEWYAYDSEDRVATGQGTRDGATIGLDSTDPNSAAISYDADGKRTATAFFENGNWVLESYFYDDNGRLNLVMRNGVPYSVQTYDAQGRVAKLAQVAQGATTTYTYAFDANLWRYTDTSTTTSGNTTVVTTTQRDMAGRVLSTGSVQTSVQDSQTYTLTTSTTYTYRNANSTQLLTVVSSAMDSEVGALDSDTVTYFYDGFDNLVRVHRSSQPSTDTTYINDAGGKVLRRNELDGAQYFYFALGEQIAERTAQSATGGSIHVATGQVVISADKVIPRGEYWLVNVNGALEIVSPFGAYNIPYWGGPGNNNRWGINYNTQDHWTEAVYERAVAEARAVVNYLQSLSAAARGEAIKKLKSDGLSITLRVGIGSLEDKGTYTADEPIMLEGWGEVTGVEYRVLGQQYETFVTKTVDTLKLTGDSDAELFAFFIQQVVTAINNGVVDLYWDTVSPGGYTVPFVQDFEFSFSQSFSVAASSSLDTDTFYEPTPVGAGASVGTYTVQAGDTLQSLALAIYGNAGLWYVIADRNGLGGLEALRPGQQLTLPNVVSGANNVDTYKPYSSSGALGDVGPQLALASPGSAPVYDIPPAPRNRGPQGLAEIFAMIAVVLVAAIVGIFTAGVGLALLGPGIGLLASAAIGTVSSVASSLASQGVLVATGLQQNIDWAQVGVDTLIGALTFGLGSKLTQLGKGAGRIAQVVQAINRATASASVLRYAGNVAANAVSGLAGALASEGLMKLIDPQREVDWAHVAAMGAGMGGGMSLLSRPAKYLPEPDRKDFVLNISSDVDVRSTSFALLQKPGRGNMDEAAIAAGQLTTLNGDSKLFIPGHGGVGTIDGKTPQELAAFLKQKGVREVGQFSLVACGFAPTGKGQKSFAEDFAEALTAQGIKFKSISAREGRVAVLPDGRKVVVDDSDNIYSKGQGTKIVVNNQRDENGNFIVDGNPYQAPGRLRNDLNIDELTLLPNPKKVRRGSDSDEEEYVEPTPGGRPRPSYESARKAVEKNQNLTKSASGNHMEFDSVMVSGRVNQLDKNGKETLPRALGKTGTLAPTKPALDHEIQFAALQEQYDQMVVAERAKPPLTRESSVDLYAAFSAAVRDPSNLRLVTHAEHVSFGGAKQKGSFSAADQSDARRLIVTHLNAIPSKTPQSVSEATWIRPLAALPQPSTLAAAQPLPRPSRGPVVDYSKMGYISDDEMDVV